MELYKRISHSFCVQKIDWFMILGVCVYLCVYDELTAKRCLFLLNQVQIVCVFVCFLIHARVHTDTHNLIGKVDESVCVCV